MEATSVGGGEICRVNCFAAAMLRSWTNVVAWRKLPGAT